MSHALADNYLNLYSSCKQIGAGKTNEVFAKGYFGPECTFRQLLSALHQETKSEEGPVQKALKDVQRGFVAQGHLISQQHCLFEDPTTPQRWKALSLLVELILTGILQSSGREKLRECIDAFKKIELPKQKCDYGSVIILTDEEDKLDREIFSEQSHSIGYWILLDCLSQLRGIEPKTQERTTIFTASGAGGDWFEFIVEAMPGPAGLVLPNFWKLGLLPFASTSEKRSLLEATQQAMVMIASQYQLNYRIRWHVKHNPKSISWYKGIYGRSAMASAAIATKAILEKLKAHNDVKEPFLSSYTAITAELDLKNGKMMKVDNIAEKAKAARQAGVEELLILKGTKPTLTTADTQNMADLVEFENLEEAFQYMQSVEGAFEGYRAKLQSEDKFEYYPEQLAS